MADNSSSQETGSNADSQEGAAAADNTSQAGTEAGAEDGGQAGADNKEATEKIRVLSEEKKVLEETNASLVESNKTLQGNVEEINKRLGINQPAAEENEENKPDPRYATTDQVFDMQFDTQMEKHPKIAEHKEEVKKYMKENNLPFGKAANQVYLDHGMLNDEKVLASLQTETIPSAPSPGGREVDGDDRSPDQRKRDDVEGISQEDRKKFGAKVAAIGKAKGLQGSI